MKVFRQKLSTNLLLLILNLNLFAIQYVVFMTWRSRSRTSGEEAQKIDEDVTINGKKVDDVVKMDTGSHDSVDSDEVFVYNGKLNPGEIHTPSPTPGPNRVPNGTWDWNWDERANTNPTAQRFLYFVRHGQYYGSGPYEKHLSTLGKIQAKKAGEKLRSLNLTFHKFISSTSIRAAETADVIHKYVADLGIEYSDELREGWPSFPDPASPGMWNKDDPIFNLDIPRIKGAFEKFVHRADPGQKGDSNEIIVAHGNVIAYTVLRSLQVPVERWLKIGVLQGSISLLQVHPNGDVSLRILGDVGHLPKSEWSG